MPPGRWPDAQPLLMLALVPALAGERAVAVVGGKPSLHGGVVWSPSLMGAEPSEPHGVPGLPGGVVAAEPEPAAAAAAAAAAGVRGGVDQLPRAHGPWELGARCCAARQARHPTRSVWKACAARYELPSCSFAALCTASRFGWQTSCGPLPPGSGQAVLPQSHLRSRCLAPIMWGC